ncbi:uncharacterized protein Dana_GF20898 [Drosophila ananassae]|uniref:Calponin-homology (CH) domain-containing protein n=1 Tax=Drosophila ananassae TaxID=7217 RepID=B3MRZ9_DROAN|nr:uncharacterized protein LOC6503590 [Drosophila ananassae]EDV34554.2 uncharacterized protein Dana_GF20898 [Drosophila ananassae]
MSVNETRMLNQDTQMTALDLRKERFLVSWVNRELRADFQIVEEFCTGAAFCQLVDRVQPGIIDLRRVKFMCNRMTAFRGNYNLLEEGLLKLGIDKAVLDKILPLEKIIRGHHRALSELTARIRRLVRRYATDYPEPYNALERRGYQDICVAAPEMVDVACQAALGADMLRLRLVRWDLNLIDDGENRNGDPNGPPNGDPNGPPNDDPNGPPNGDPNGEPNGNPNGDQNGDPNGVPNGDSNANLNGDPTDQPNGEPTANVQAEEAPAQEQATTSGGASGDTATASVRPTRRGHFLPLTNLSSYHDVFNNAVRAQLMQTLTHAERPQASSSSSTSSSSSSTNSQSN